LLQSFFLFKVKFQIVISCKSAKRSHIGDKDDITCFGAISLIPSSPCSPLRVRAPSTKWENSSFDGALSSRARPMRTCSQFAPQTRTENERENFCERQFGLPLRRVVSHYRKKVSSSELYTDNTGERGDCRNFGTSITCRDKATCPVETHGRSTYNAIEVFFGLNTPNRISWI